jgi:hypothetical protein
MFDERFTVKRLGLGYHQVELRGTSQFVYSVIESLKQQDITLYEDLPIVYGPYELDMARTSDMLWADMGMKNTNSFAFVLDDDTLVYLKMRYS